MPVFRAKDRIAKTGGGGPCGAYSADRISDTGGLTQFGAVIETLPPGSSSSIKHWHAAEDEMVLVLDGTVTLIEGEEEAELAPGDAATFRAGIAVGHCLINRSASDVRYLVVGTRAARDVVTYPDHDRVLTRDRTAGEARWTDAAGAPAPDLYTEDG